MATDFSRTLSLLRQEKGISQRKAAAALGISQALLSHYENGIREPGLAFVCKVCDFYRVSADFLLGRTANRDGAMIDSETLYDGSTEKGSLRGSIMATLQKKLAVNTTGLLFDLLSRTNSREASTAAGVCLGATLFDLLRRLYRQRGGGLRCRRSGRGAAAEPRSLYAGTDGGGGTAPPELRRADHPARHRAERRPGHPQRGRTGREVRRFSVCLTNPISATSPSSPTSTTVNPFPNLPDGKPGSLLLISHPRRK